MPLAAVPYPISSSAFPGRDSIVAHGFVELPIPDLISVFHATSSPFPTLQPGLKAFVVIASSSGVVSKMPQTMGSATHPLASY